MHLLAVLQRAGGVIGDLRAAGPCRPAFEPRPTRYSRDIAGQRRDPGGLGRIGLVGAQHEAVVLHRGAAAGDGDEDGVEPLAFDLTRPRIDIGPRLCQRWLLTPDVMVERAAAALPSATTTSTPCRLSNRMVACVMLGASASLAQPAINATRPCRAPFAG